jgi:hypothetical protein
MTETQHAQSPDLLKDVNAALFTSLVTNTEARLLISIGDKKLDKVPKKGKVTKTMRNAEECAGKLGYQSAALQDAMCPAILAVATEIMLD